MGSDGGIKESRRIRANAILPSLMHNPIREAGQTCLVCAGPRDSNSDLCNRCREWKSLAGMHLADRLVPLTYAIQEVNPQTRYDLRQYKDGVQPAIRADAALRLTALTWHFSQYHAQCLNTSGLPVTLFATVPSKRVRTRPEGHPLDLIARYLPEAWGRVALERVADVAERNVVSGSVEVKDHHAVSGAHVAVFDDAWVTGAAAQTVAVALKRAGAAEVSIIVIGRILNYGWGPTPELVEKFKSIPWSGSVCPVTGASCPGRS